MGKVLLAATGNAALSANNGNYSALAGGNLTNQSTEAQRQVVTRVPATISLLAVRKENAFGEGVHIRSRVNGANGNQDCAPADGAAAGVYEDLSNSDSLSAGDRFNVSITETHTTSPQLYWMRMVFEASGGHACLYACTNPSNVSSASTTVFTALSGNGNMSSAEANKRCRARTAGTLTGGYVYVSANARTTDTVFRSRINGADGNIVITVGAGLTGLFQDTTHTDTISAGDDVNWSITTGSGTQTLTPQLIGTTIVCGAQQNDLFASTGAQSRTASGTASFTNFTGASGNTTMEARCQVRHGFAGTASRLRLYVSANSYSGDATVTFRKNGVDGNQAITIPAGATGLFEDTSSSDDFDADDDCCVKIVGGTTGSLTYQWIGITEAPQAGATHDGEGAWTGDAVFGATLSAVRFGVAALSGAGGWSADGAVGKFGGASWTGAASATALGRLGAVGAGSWTETAGLAATGSVTGRGTADWAGTAAVTGDAQRLRYGNSMWGGSGALASAGRLIGRARGAWSDGGALGANGGVVQLGTAAWAGEGRVSAFGRSVRVFVGSPAGGSLEFGGKSAAASSNWGGKTA